METDIMSAVMLKTGCEDNEMGLINIISDRKKCNFGFGCDSLYYNARKNCGDSYCGGKRI